MDGELRVGRVAGDAKATQLGMGPKINHTAPFTKWCEPIHQLLKQTDFLRAVTEVGMGPE